MEKVIEKDLEFFGFSNKHKGFYYTREAIIKAVEKLRVNEKVTIKEGVLAEIAKDLEYSTGRVYMSVTNAYKKARSIKSQTFREYDITGLKSLILWIAKKHVGDDFFDPDGYDFPEAAQRAKEKLNRIIAREGDLNGARRTQVYFKALYDEELLAQRVSEVLI